MRAARKILKASGKLPLPQDALQEIDLKELMEAVAACLDEEVAGDFCDGGNSGRHPCACVCGRKLADREKDDMKIRIRTKTMNLSLPVPVSAAGMVIRKIPDSVFKGLQKNVPEPYSAFCSREALLFLVRECAGTLRTIHNLEIIHIETEGGTYISIKM